MNGGILLLLGVVIISVLAVTLDWWGARQLVLNRAFNSPLKTLDSPPEEWCQEGLINPGPSDFTPQKIIQEWNGKESCCEKTVIGYDCGINTTVNLTYCYRGQVGMFIKNSELATTNPTLKYSNLSSEQTLLVQDNIHKRDTFSVCDTSEYPEQLMIGE